MPKLHTYTKTDIQFILSNLVHVTHAPPDGMPTSFETDCFIEDLCRRLRIPPKAVLGYTPSETHALDAILEEATP